jgi:flavin-dependent dehydrogenase
MRVAVVGSGPAGVAAARALLDGGLAVDMLDFGNEIESSAKDLASRLRSGSPSAKDLLGSRRTRSQRRKQA